jgi:hypothetical protein
VPPEDGQGEQSTSITARYTHQNCVRAVPPEDGQGEQSTSITARYNHQNCFRVVPPEDGQVMPETCRGFEF